MSIMLTATRIIAIILATITLLILATYPNTSEEYDNGPRRRRLPGLFISQIALAVIFVAGIFVLVSVLWQV
jgi:di/tricarboxylate transporter